MRVFIAIPVPKELRLALFNACAHISDLNVLRIRLTDPQNIHATVKFIGETDGAGIQNICSSLETATQNVEPFHLLLNQAGVFPTLSRPRIVWFGGTLPEGLIRLQRRLEDLCEVNGIPKEKKPFKLHLTVARIDAFLPMKTEMKAREIIQRLNQLEPEKVYVDQIVVYRSDLSTGKPIYSPLYTQKLDFMLRSDSQK